MKFSKLYKLFLLAAVSFFGIAAIQSPTGAPEASTGAPGEQNCTACHRGSVNTGTGEASITVDGSDITKYVPGRKYDLTLRTEQAGIPKFGMQVTVLDANNKKVGTLAKTGTDLQLITDSRLNRDYLTHTGNGNTVSNAKDWKFSWTAPATNAGIITIYVAWMASNNDRGNNGDQVYTATLELNPDLTAIESRNLPENWSLAPNPSEGDFNLRFDMTQPQPVELTVVNTSGQLVLVKNWTNTGNTFNENISLSHLSKGVYMAQVKVGEKQYVERIMVK